MPMPNEGGLQPYTEVPEWYRRVKPALQQGVPPKEAIRKDIQAQFDAAQARGRPPKPAAPQANEGPDIPLGPESDIPAMPSLSQPDTEERMRRQRAADFRRQEAAKANEELTRWDQSGQDINADARRLRELARDRMQHQAQNIEQTGDAGVTPFDEEYQSLLRHSQVPAAVLRAKDATRTRRDMKRYAGRLLDLNTDSESADLGKDTQEAIIAAARGMPPEEAMPLLRDKADELELRRRAQASRAQRDNAVNYNLSRMSPAQYKAFLLRSATNATDPMEAAHIQAQLGNNELAQAIMQSHARQQEMASNERVEAGHDAALVRSREAEAKGVRDAAQAKAAADSPAGQAAAFREEAEKVLANTAPELMESALMDLYTQSRPNTPPAVAQAEARRVIAGYHARTTPNHPTVSAHLNKLVADGDYQGFLEWANANLGWSRTRAMNEYTRRMSPAGWVGFKLWNALGGG